MKHHCRYVIDMNFIPKLCGYCRFAGNIDYPKEKCRRCSLNASFCGDRFIYSVEGHEWFVKSGEVGTMYVKISFSFGASCAVLLQESGQFPGHRNVWVLINSLNGSTNILPGPIHKYLNDSTVLL